MLVLRVWEVDATLQELSFASSPLWLHIHGLPLGRMTRAFALDFGALAGSVLEANFDTSKQVWGMACLRVSVQVDLFQPLLPGFYLD